MDTETGGLTERASELQPQTRPERPGILAECQPTTRIRLTVYLSLFKDRPGMGSANCWRGGVKTVAKRTGHRILLDRRGRILLDRRGRILLEGGRILLVGGDHPAERGENPSVCGGESSCREGRIVPWRGRILPQRRENPPGEGGESSCREGRILLWGGRILLCVWGGESSCREGVPFTPALPGLPLMLSRASGAWGSCQHRGSPETLLSFSAQPESQHRPMRVPGLTQGADPGRGLQSGSLSWHRFRHILFPFGPWIPASDK